jgi:hypothetical protein
MTAFPGVWVVVKPSACSTFAGQRGIVCAIRRQQRGAMVLFVGELMPLFFGVGELELDTRESAREAAE